MRNAVIIVAALALLVFAVAYVIFNIVVTVRSMRRLSALVAGLDMPYASWLASECWVRPCSRPDGWRRCVVVAVSWRGAVCVREMSRPHDNKSYWIKKENTLSRVRFCEERPTEDEWGCDCEQHK